MGEPTGVDTGDEAPKDRRPVTGMPRWVKAFLLVGLLLVLLFVVGKVTGVGDEHGPGRHGGGDEPSSVEDDDDGHQSPVDHDP